MSSNSTQTRCYPEDHLLLMGNLEKYINNYIFPIQFLITVIGNLLTMSVLLSAHMKNRANHILACLALCDILVFVMMFSHYLASIDFFSQSVDFRLFHFHTKVHFAALTNWFSAAAIWFILAVSIERLMIIKYPFRSLEAYNSKRVFLLTSSIFTLTFILTSYHHVSHTCLSWIVCNETQAVGICFPNVMDSFGRRPNPTSSLVKTWINISIYLNAGFAVLLPIIAVAIINISLIRLLKRRNNEELILNNVNMNTTTLHEQEKKMTNTVLAIVSCFSLTQGPSALVFTLHRLYPNAPVMRDISIIANQLVLTGKMLNVVLFCLTSESFRKKMMHTCRCWMLMIFYCDRSKARWRISREQSKSIVTQKTSIVYSPSGRTRRVSALSDSISMRTQVQREIVDSPLVSSRSQQS
ncbi:unnamed protein product [Auanema sp. JU1783]|nr:unnamed protein product [Auanema sp. JU1783]